MSGEEQFDIVIVIKSSGFGKKSIKRFQGDLYSDLNSDGFTVTNGTNMFLFFFFCLLFITVAFMPVTHG
jgi:hypothetical protein